MTATHMASKTPKNFHDGEKNIGQHLLKAPDSLKTMSYRKNKTLFLKTCQTYYFGFRKLTLITYVDVKEAENHISTLFYTKLYWSKPFHLKWLFNNGHQIIIKFKTVAGLSFISFKISKKSFQ